MGSPEDLAAAVIEPRQRWVWAGIVVRDEQGNMMAFEMDDPQGQVESSQQVHVVRGRQGGTQHFTLGSTLLRVHLRGLAREWSGDIPTSRSVGESPHVVDSTYREMEMDDGS